MTTKQQVNLETYHKPPRILQKPMELALGPNGDLHPILEAVINDHRLRLDIREDRFNVYYGGGNLLLVDGRKSPWVLHFDAKYFKGGSLTAPVLPNELTSVNAPLAWVRTFPELIAGMEDWWKRHARGERADCQAIAAANSASSGLPKSEYLVLDLEYQWAQRRFDLVAARRSPTSHDETGWVEPELVLVEVKSDYGACTGSSGLGDHARDFRDIALARSGRCVSDIKLEYQDMLAQKMRLGLVDVSLGFKRFSSSAPELLIVFVHIDPTMNRLSAPLAEVSAVSESLGDRARIRFMRLNAPDYAMGINSAKVDAALDGQAVT